MVRLPSHHTQSSRRRCARAFLVGVGKETLVHDFSHVHGYVNMAVCANYLKRFLAADLNSTNHYRAAHDFRC